MKGAGGKAAGKKNVAHSFHGSHGERPNCRGKQLQHAKREGSRAQDTKKEIGREPKSY